MYESWKECKKDPSHCAVCNSPLIKDSPAFKANMIYVKASCSGCHCSITLCYDLRLVKDLKLTPKAKKILAARRKEAENDGNFEIDVETTAGRLQVGL